MVRYRPDSQELCEQIAILIHYTKDLQYPASSIVESLLYISHLHAVCRGVGAHETREQSVARTAALWEAAARHAHHDARRRHALPALEQATPVTVVGRDGGV